MEQRRRPSRNPIIITREREACRLIRLGKFRWEPTYRSLWNNVELRDGLAPARVEIKMKARAFALLLSLAMMACAALAHGNQKHIVGTVEKIDADSVTVKTADGKSVEVKLVAATSYVMRSGTVDKPAKSSDLAVGDRVVIHATPKGQVLEAAEVRFCAPAAVATSKPKP